MLKALREPMLGKQAHVPKTETVISYPVRKLGDVVGSQKRMRRDYKNFLPAQLPDTFLWQQVRSLLVTLPQKLSSTEVLQILHVVGSNLRKMPAPTALLRQPEHLAQIEAETTPLPENGE